MGVFSHCQKIKCLKLSKLHILPLDPLYVVPKELKKELLKVIEHETEHFFILLCLKLDVER